MDDKMIINLYWKRDENAIEATSEKYGAYCCQIAGNILLDFEDVKECVNDTWLNAWNAIPPHRPFKLSAFLGKITRNLSINRYKARVAQKRGGGELALALDELDDCIAGRESVEQAVEDARAGRVISEFLRMQPEKSADMFIRRYYHVCSVKQIASEFGMSESKVKSILFRMRKNLSIYLEGEDISL